MPADTRTCRCHVRFTPAEMKLLKQVGTKEHRTTPELVRHAALKWLEQQEAPMRFDPSWMAGPPRPDLLQDEQQEIGGYRRHPQDGGTAFLSTSGSVSTKTSGA